MTNYRTVSPPSLSSLRGKALLLVGAISGILAFTGGIDQLYEFIQDYWVVTWAGTFLLFLSLLLIGVLALRRKPLPRWNWLPLLSGVFPVALLIGAITGGDFQGDDALCGSGPPIDSCVAATGVHAAG
jgi:hypothetical protein